MPHIHEKIDFCSEVFVVYKNNVLLRKHDKYKMWFGVGGHVELDEDPNEAAIREVKEEVGLDVELISEKNSFPELDVGNNKSLIPPYFLNRHRINDSHEHLGLIYFAKSNTDELVLSETEVAEECRWFNKEELEANEYGIGEDVLIYALTALEKSII